MSAFPTSPANGTLAKARDDLREQVMKLHEIVAWATNWVEQLERDRIAHVGVWPEYPTDAAFDAAHLTMAQTLLTQIGNETNDALTGSLRYRVRTTLQIQE